MRVAAGQSLYKVADVSVVWVEADVFERELPFVRTGMGARVTLDALPGEALQGASPTCTPSSKSGHGPSACGLSSPTGADA